MATSLVLYVRSSDVRSSRSYVDIKVKGFIEEADQL